MPARDPQIEAGLAGGASGYGRVVSTPRTLTLPVGVSRAQVETPVGSFAVLTAGPSTSELPVVVLVPGWTGSKEDFLTLLPEIASSGRRVVALDQRGQLDTPGPDSVDAYSLDGFATDLLAVVDAVAEEPVDLLAHSFGGLVAARATVLAPFAVSSLVLLCSGPGALPVERHGELTALADALETLGAADTWTAMRARERAAGVVMPPAEIEDWLQHRFLASSTAALVAKTRLLVEAPDHREALRNRPTPTMIMTGSLDDAWPVEVQAEFAASIGAEYAVLDGLGHSPAVEDPTGTARVLVDFWDAWRPTTHRTHADLSSQTTEVRRARHLVRDFAGEVLPARRLDDAELLTSELVTNALLHAEAPVHLDVVVRGGYLTVLVADSGGGPELDSRIHHGRGLPIVTALAHRCGAWTTDAGARVWFWMPVGQPRSPSSCRATPIGSSPAQLSMAGPTSAPSGHESR
jgi:pimeloyl-ACP methyl ester carboxylesterase